VTIKVGFGLERMTLDSSRGPRIRECSFVVCQRYMIVRVCTAEKVSFKRVNL